MEKTLDNAEKYQKMSKKNLIDNFVEICMNIAKNQLITDESLIDKYLTNKEEAYIKTKQALYKHLKKFLKIELQHIIFIKYDITSITKYVLEKNNTIKIKDE